MNPRCPRCNTEVVLYAPFCTNCGAYLPHTHRLNPSEPVAESTDETAPVPATEVEAQTKTVTLDPPKPAALEPGPRTSRRGRKVLWTGAAAVVLVGAAGAAAYAIPVAAYGPDKSVAEMLPASTAGFIAVDLNPSGNARVNLQKLEKAFTSQPGWNHVKGTFNSQTSGNSTRSGCYTDVTGGVLGRTNLLGHDTTLALIGTKGINASSGATSSAMSTAFQKQVVVLAPIDARVPLVQRLMGMHFSLPQTATTYRGVTIYKQTVQSCGKAAAGAPNTYYAALYKGYVVGGLMPDAIEKVVDTDADGAATLASSKDYTTMMAALPEDRVAAYYLSGPALKATGVSKAAGASPFTSGLSASNVNGAIRSTAAALSVEGDGVRLTAVTGTNGHVSSSTATAGAASSIVPSDVLGIISIGGVPELIKNAVTQLEAAKIVDSSTQTQIDAIEADILPDMKGEADIVLFRGQGPLKLDSLSNYNLPLTVMWPVSDDVTARGHLDDVVTTLKDTGDFVTKTASDGTEYRLASGTQGGYAVRKGWAVASLGIASTLDTLSSAPVDPLSGTPEYQSTFPAGGTVSSLWYINTNNLREDLESALLPTQLADTVSLYKQNAQPLLAPIRSIAGSTSQRAGGITVSTFKVRISATR